MSSDAVVSDKDLEDAFRGSNFGVSDHRALLETSVLKQLLGHECGYTIEMIMRRLGLITKPLYVTSKGKKLLAQAFAERLKWGG